MQFSPRHYHSTYALVLDLFRKNPEAARVFASVTFVSVCIGILGSYLYSLILTTNTNEPVLVLVLAYLGHKTLDWICELPIYMLQQRSVQVISSYFEEKCLEWYSVRVSLESRERVDASKFHSAVQDLQGSVIKSLSFWLVFQCIHVISSLFAACFSFGIQFAWMIAGQILLVGLVASLIYLPRRSALITLEEVRS